LIESPHRAFVIIKRRCEMENVKDGKKITPEKALEILNNGGLKVTLEQAKLILDFLY
jgi:hypothetical protein